MLRQSIASVLVLIAGSTAQAQWSAADLNPPYHAASATVAGGGAGSQVVGTAHAFGFRSSHNHAVLWSGNGPGGCAYVDVDLLAAYFSLDMQADFNHSGAVCIQDVFDFLTAYFTAC